MRNLLLVALVAVAVCWLVSGCNPASVGALTLDGTRQAVHGQNYDYGVVDSKYERFQRIAMQRDIEDRQFRDDLDMIFLLDRNSYMSQWHAGVAR